MSNLNRKYIFKFFAQFPEGNCKQGKKMDILFLFFLQIILENKKLLKILIRHVCVAIVF